MREQGVIGERRDRETWGPGVRLSVYERMREKQKVNEEKHEDEEKRNRPEKSEKKRRAPGVWRVFTCSTV